MKSSFGTGRRCCSKNQILLNRIRNQNYKGLDLNTQYSLIFFEDTFHECTILVHPHFDNFIGLVATNPTKFLFKRRALLRSRGRCMFYNSPVAACEHVRNLSFDWRCHTSNDATQGFRNNIDSRGVVAGKRVFGTGDGPGDVIGDIFKEGRWVAFFEWCERLFNEFDRDHQEGIGVGIWETRRGAEKEAGSGYGRINASPYALWD